jgi:hypothetical protein
LQFPTPHFERGNGAREALIAHIRDICTADKEAEDWADYMLANLWAQGFKIVPVD